MGADTVHQLSPTDVGIIALVSPELAPVVVLQTVTSFKIATLNGIIPLLTPVLVPMTKLYFRSLVDETSSKHRDWFESLSEHRRSTICFLNLRI